VPVRLRVHRKSLYLRCSRLPPKAGHEVGHRYELAQGPVSAPVVRRAEAQAHALWAAVVERRFEWADFDTNHKRDSGSVAEWVGKLKAEHLSTGQCSPETWAKHWEGAVFSKMPQDAKLTQATILAAVLAPPNPGALSLPAWWCSVSGLARRFSLSSSISTLLG
jgi:hypothetical protein